jgi:hypothetical protein
MAGLICAITAERDDAKPLIERALPALLYQPSFTVHWYDTAHFAAALVLPRATAPTFFGELADGSFAAVHGELYPPPGEDLASALARVCQDALSDDSPVAESLDGLYHLATWSPRRRTGALSTDVLGALLLFHSQIDGNLVAASEPGPILRLRASVKPDVSGIASILQMGYQADHRTDVEGLSVLPPGTVRRIQVQGLGLKVAERACRQSGARADEPEERFLDLLSSAVKRSCGGPEPICLPLTGGEDSRLLGGVLRQLGITFDTRTLDGQQANDAHVAVRVAKQLGTETAPIELDPDSVRANVDLMKNAFGATLDWHGATFLPLFQSIEPGSRIVLGFLGGELAGSPVLRRSPSAEGRLEQARAWYRYRSSARAGNGLPPAPTEPDWIPIAAPGALPFELLSNLYGRQRRYISFMLRLAWNFGRPVCCFADRALLQWTLSRKREELYDRRSRRAAFCRAFPELAHLPNGNDLLPLDAELSRAVRRLLRGTRIRSALRALIPLPRPFQPDRLWAAVSPAVAQLDAERREFVERWSDSSSVFGAFALLALAYSTSRAGLRSAEQLLASA